MGQMLHAQNVVPTTTHVPLRFFATKAKAEKATEDPKVEKEKDDSKVADEAKKQMADEIKRKAKEEAKTHKTKSKTEDTTEKSEADNRVEKLEKQMKELEQELDKQKEETKNYLNKYRYQLAENDNTVKRYLEQVKKAKEYSIGNFAKDLLTVRDNLQLAIEHSQKFDVDNTDDLDK